MSADAILKDMRADALKIFYQALEAVDPAKSILNSCRLENDRLIINDTAYNLSKYKKIRVIGAGKASAAMAKAVEDLLGDRITRGLVITKYHHTLPLKKIRLMEAGHPVPDENSVKATKALFNLLQNTDEKTLFICLLSGGGSSLMALPQKGLTLADKQDTTRALLQCGADINEINTIRRQLSAVKGGKLAAAVYPAEMVCLVLSDVIGNDLSTIASGPAVADPGSIEQCLSIIKRYGIAEKLPPAVMRYFKNRAEIPAADFEQKNRLPGKVRHFIIADNTKALLAARTAAGEMGYQPIILSSMVKGETRESAIFHCSIAKEVLTSGHPAAAPACILSGGETTVTIRGKGKGGRNQEFCLACVEQIRDCPHIVILSAGTDGTDGPTDAAGALADHETWHRAMASGFNPRNFLEENDAYHFFDHLADLVITGPTLTNVMDLRIILIKP